MTGKRDGPLEESLLRGVPQGYVLKSNFWLLQVSLWKCFEVKSPGVHLASLLGLLHDWALQGRG